MDPSIEPAIFEGALGRLVIAWNQAEERMRALLAGFIRSAHTREQIVLSIVLTVELGSVGLENALTAVAADVLGGEQGDAVKYAAKLMGRLRAYRNYYVHGVGSIMTSASTGPLGLVELWSAKSTAVSHSEEVSAQMLADLTTRAQALASYANAVSNHVHWSKRPFRDDASPPPLPDKPPLPPQLVKSSLSLPPPPLRP